MKSQAIPLWGVLYGLILSLALACSNANAEMPELTRLLNNESVVLEKFTEKEHNITIDGKLDEELWKTLRAYDEFVVIDPDTLAPADHATHVRLFNTERGLYVGIDMAQPEGTLVKRLSGRDVRSLNRDSINITLDTSGEGRYGFWFGVNLGDSLMDGTVLPERKFSSEWDGPWRAATQETDIGWSAEMFIPWAAVSMPSGGGDRQMGLYMSRKVAYQDVRYGWPGLSSTKPVFMSALQKMEMRDVRPTQQYNVYPFIATTGDNIDDDVSHRVGADVFWRPSTNFQVNATINPDFGGVESDDVVINLTAVEVFFSEKRLFFQEGQEIFVASPRAAIQNNGVGNGGDPYTLVNTRRIGGVARAPLNPDNLDISQRELIQPAELIGAAKINGQSGKIRYGFLGASEKSTKFDASTVDANGVLLDENLSSDGSDYAIARLLYETNEGGGYRALGFLSTAVLNDQGNALAQAVDWHYLSNGGGLTIDGQAFTSDIDGVERGWGGFVDFELTPQRGQRFRLGLEYTDRNVDINDLGFLGRNDRYRVRGSYIRTRSNPRIGRNNQFDIRGFVDQNTSEEFLGAGVFVSNRLTLNNLSSITARLSHFTPAIDDLNSFGNGSYRITERSGFSIGYGTNSSDRFSYGFGVGFDEENLSGDSFNARARLSWRPIDRMNMELGVRYSNRNGWLLHQEDANFTTFDANFWQPRFALEYFFSAQQQFRISAQWVAVKAREQDFFLVPSTPDNLIETTKPPGPSDDFAITDMVIQARYRWQIAPLSDLFIVYTRTSDVSLALQDEDLGDLLSRSFNQPIGDQLVIKLRYRFGS